MGTSRSLKIYGRIVHGKRLREFVLECFSVYEEASPVASEALTACVNAPGLTRVDYLQLHHNSPIPLTLAVNPGATTFKELQQATGFHLRVCRRPNSYNSRWKSSSL